MAGRNSMVRFVGWGAGPDSSYATRTANLGTAQNTAERWNKFNNRMNLMSQLTSDVGNLIEAPGSERYAAKVAADKEARKANMETVDAWGGAYDRADKIVSGLETRIGKIEEEGLAPPEYLTDQLEEAKRVRDRYNENYEAALGSIGISEALLGGTGGDTDQQKRNAMLAGGGQTDTSTVTSVDRGNVVDRMLSNLVDKRGSVTETPPVTEVVGGEKLNPEAVSPNAEDVDSSFSNALLDTAMATAGDAWKFATDPDAPYNPGVEAIAKDIGSGNPLGKQWITNMFDAATNRDNWSIFPSERRRILHDAGYNFGVRPGFPIEPPRGGPPETPRSVRPEPQIERNLDKFTPSPYSQVETPQKDETPLQADLSQNPKEITPDEMSSLGNQFWKGVDNYAEKVFGENKDIALAGLLVALSIHPVGRILLRAQTKKQFEKAAKHPKVREVVKDFMRGRQSEAGPPLPKDYSATRRAGPPVNPNPRPRVNLNLRPEQKDILKILK